MSAAASAGQSPSPPSRSRPAPPVPPRPNALPIAVPTGSLAPTLAVHLPPPPPPPAPSVPVPVAAFGSGPSASAAGAGGAAGGGHHPPQLPMGLWRAPAVATPLSLRATQTGANSAGTGNKAALARALADGNGNGSGNGPEHSGSGSGSTQGPSSGMSDPKSTTNTAGGAGAKQAAAAEDDEEQVKLINKERNLSWDDLKRMAQNAQRVRAEILSTEDSYLTNLRRLHKAYIVPLMQTDPEELGIEDFHRRTLVSNLEQLVTVHSQFNQDLISGGADNIEHAMINYSRYFKMYSVYLNDYLKCLTTLESLRRSKLFQGFVARVNERLKEESSLSLMDYLIMPVQRLPRYVLLLRELRRNTVPSSAGFDLVNVALAKVRETATAVNEKSREAEKMQELAQVFNALTGDFKDLTLVEAHRRLVRKGEVMMEEERQGGLFGTSVYLKTAPRTVYLFNDLLMWTNKSCVYKAHMFTSSIEISPAIPSTSTYAQSTGFGCLLSNAKSKITLHFASEDEYNAWLPDITAHVREQKMVRAQKREILNQRATQKKPKTAHNIIYEGLNDLNRKTLHRQSLASAGSAAPYGSGGDGDDDGNGSPVASPDAEDGSPMPDSSPSTNAAGGDSPVVSSSQSPNVPPPPPPAALAGAGANPGAGAMPRGITANRVPSRGTGARVGAAGSTAAGGAGAGKMDLAASLANLKLAQQRNKAAAAAGATTTTNAAQT